MALTAFEGVYIVGKVVPGARVTSWSAAVVARIIMVCVYVYEDQLGSQNRVQVSDLIKYYTNKLFLSGECQCLSAQV